MTFIKALNLAVCFSLLLVGKSYQIPYLISGKFEDFSYTLKMIYITVPIIYYLCLNLVTFSKLK